MTEEDSGKPGSFFLRPIVERVEGPSRKDDVTTLKEMFEDTLIKMMLAWLVLYAAIGLTTAFVHNNKIQNERDPDPCEGIEDCWVIDYWSY